MLSETNIPIKPSFSGFIKAYSTKGDFNSVVFHVLENKFQHLLFYFLIRM
jgi:hypothetical protein